MNINDVQQTNSKTSINTLSIKNYTSGRKDTSDFSYYVETSKANESVSQAQSVQEDTQQVPEEELLLNEEENDDATLAYLQSLQNLNSELFDMGIADDGVESKFDKDMMLYQINLKDLNMNDIKLFEGLTQKADVSINSVNTENQTFNMQINGENLDISYKSIEISKTLFAAIENAHKTGKPVRLDFGQDASVILRIGKDGKISAEFLPNDKAMEMALKSALPLLKAKFDEENIPYGTLNYKQFNQQKDNRNNNKEKSKDE